MLRFVTIPLSLDTYPERERERERNEYVCSFRKIDDIGEGRQREGEAKKDGAGWWERARQSGWIGERERTGSLSPSARSIRIINNPWRRGGGGNRNISRAQAKPRRQINYYRPRQVLSRLFHGGRNGLSPVMSVLGERWCVVYRVSVERVWSSGWGGGPSRACPTHRQA